MGAGALGRRRRDEPGDRRACARLCGELDHRMVCLRSPRARRARPRGRTRRSRASCISAGRRSRRRTARVRRSPKSSRDSAVRTGASCSTTDRQERPRPAARSVQGDHRAAPDRLDHLDERERRRSISRPTRISTACISRPPMVMFASEGRKDSLAFVEETKEFVCNLATWDLREQMNQTSAPYPARHQRDRPTPASRPRPRGWSSRRASPKRPARSNANGCRPSQLNDVDGTAARRLGGVRPAWSACTSTSASSATACSTPPP